MTDGMRFVSLFSGIGGLDLGLERAGFECVMQCERDSACQRVLQRHWPGVDLRDDVCTLRGKEIPEADVWAFGSPCQDNSKANGQGRKGLVGPKSGLAWQVERLLKERRERPRILVWENVDGLWDAPLTESVAGYLCALAELGYIVAQPVLVRGVDVGVPQLRPRWFTLLSRSELPMPEHSWERRDSRLADCLDDVDGPWLTEAERLKLLGHVRRRWKGISRREQVIERYAELLELRSPEVRAFTRNWSWSPLGDYCPTLSCDKDAFVHIPGRGIRRLTSAERVRLTGLPTGWLNGCSDVETARMTGNAVIPAAAEVVGRLVMEALRPARQGPAHETWPLAHR